MKVNQKGFTLVEVLVAMAILGAIMAAVVTAVILIMKTSTQNEEWNVNLRQVQNAGHWISRDTLMAQIISDNTAGAFLSLSWADWNGASHDVKYFFDGTTLKRRLTVDDVINSEILVAEYIIHDDTEGSPTKCAWDEEENRLTVTIRASLHGLEGGHVERTYEITPRPAARGG